MSEDSVSIRNAHLSDIPAIQVFMQPFVESEFVLPRSDKDMAVLVRHGFVATIGDDIVGFAALEIYSRKLAEIQALAVLSSLQGKGVGSELVRRCVGRARAEGVLELMAITASDNLFRNVGFDYSLPNQKRALDPSSMTDHPPETENGRKVLSAGDA